MPAETRPCPECGKPMAYRLGAYECPGCGRLLVDAQYLQPEPTPPEITTQPILQVPADVPPALAPPPLLASTTTAVAPQPFPPPNTSGMGADYPLPPEARGWTNASVVPFGLFSFFTGNLVWGVIGAAGTLFFLPALLYYIAVGLRGREDAWRARRFRSVAEFKTVMAAWNTAGLVIIWLSVAALLVVLVVALGVARRSLSALDQL